jgi:hypothetical protein
MKQGPFTVQRREDTRWHVCETGLERSLASFGFKEDAVEYARDLACSWAAADEDAHGNGSGESATSEATPRVGVHA